MHDVSVRTGCVCVCVWCVRMLDLAQIETMHYWLLCSRTVYQPGITPNLPNLAHQATTMQLTVDALLVTFYKHSQVC